MKSQSKPTFATLMFIGVCTCGLVILSFEIFKSNLYVSIVRKHLLSNDAIRQIRNYQMSSPSSAKFPTKLDIENVYWQELKTSNGTFKMVNAYYDDREILKDQPLIRILGYIDRTDPKVKTFCQLWFEEFADEPVVVESIYVLAWARTSAKNFQPKSNPFFINCPNPLASHRLVPTSVSLVENRNDDASNNFKVINNLPASGKKEFVAICTKDLEYPKTDISLKLIEWIEIVHLLGADKIYMYVVDVHPNIMKTLEYYAEKGKLKIEMVTVPVGFPGKWGTRLQAFQQEVISLNDCFYKNINKYEFVLPIDTDEFIMPNQEEDKSWHELIGRLKKKHPVTERICSYFAKNSYFYSNNIHENETQSEVPADIFHLQQVYRYQDTPKYFPSFQGLKSFQSTENVIVSFNHRPCTCAPNSKEREIHFNDGKLHHYKIGCGKCSGAHLERYKKDVVKDEALWKIKDELIANVKKALKEIKLE